MTNRVAPDVAYDMADGLSYIYGCDSDARARLTQSFTETIRLETRVARMQKALQAIADGKGMHPENMRQIAEHGLNDI